MTQSTTANATSTFGVPSPTIDERAEKPAAECTRDERAVTVERPRNSILPPLYTLAESLERPILQRELVWGTAIGVGERVMLSGPQKQGLKTWLGLGLACAVAAGRAFLGQPIPKARRVLYVNCEVGEDALRRRSHALKDAMGLDDEACERLHLMHLRGHGVDLSQPRFIRELIDVVKRHHIELVVIDPITEAVSVDENDAPAVAKLLKQLDELANDGVTVVLVHHWPKASSKARRQTGTIARGAAKWAEHQDTNIQSHPKGDGRIELHFECRNCETPPPIRARLDRGAVLVLDDSSARTPHKSDDERILDALERGRECTQSELSEQLGINPSPLSKRLDALQADGKVARRKGDKGRDENPRAKYVSLVSGKVSTVSAGGEAP